MSLKPSCSEVIAEVVQQTYIDGPADYAPVLLELLEVCDDSSS